MAPKRKGPPDKGAAAKLANALGTQLFSRIKVSDLQHEVLIKRKFQVPGSWWGGECPDDERDKLFMCQVVEAELTHHFQGVAMRQPALRFKLLGAAASTVDDSPLWMGTEEYSKLTHDLRKEEKEAAAKAAEEAKVAASGVKEVAAGAGEEVDAPASNIRTAGIYNHFHDPVILSTETKPHPTKPGKTIDIHHYQYTCKVIVPVEEGGDGKTECGHTRMETGSSNGNLFKHFKKAAKDNCPTHTRILAELESKSKHTATQVVNGEVVRMMSWEERFPHHIYYTAETYLDYAPFTRSRREGNRGLLSSLSPAMCHQLVKHRST